MAMMEADEEFDSFILRIRAGDESAAEELVKLYEPIIRREVRMHLVDSRMHRVFDSTDFTQSVMASFFFRACDGQYELQQPSDLVRLLVSMARNKLASGSRKLLSAKRDGKRDEFSAPDLEHVAAESETPSHVVSMLELVKKAREQLTDEERAIADLRGQGQSWDEIAQQLGGNAQSRRMQLSRAFDRVTQSLGLNE
jgi:RNA polymerase sigma-70 factor (ECF subfamily)